MPRYSVPTQIPLSVQGGEVYLESVIQDPPAVSSSASCAGLAIVAHPLGRLGGSLDDPIVTHLSALFLTRYKLRVVRFNSRGVGKSTGSASWTGASESSDFQEVVNTCLSNYCLDFPNATHSQLLIAGYSAGSLYASTVKVDKQLLEREQFRQGPKPRYILVSFPAGVQWALSFFTSRTYNTALHTLLSSSVTVNDADNAKRSSDDAPARESPAEGRSLSPSRAETSAQSLIDPLASHVLAVYGDMDQFTSLKTYQTWADQWSTIAPSPLNADSSLQSTSCQSTFHHTLVKGADHFYRAHHALDSLDEAVLSWLDELKD